MRDGTSNTIAIGESVHPHLQGVGPGYDLPDQGGPVLWFMAAACNPPCSTQSHWKYGRALRSTKYPINARLMPMASTERNDTPFGSTHAGGAQFAFADGHVSMIWDTIDMATYGSLATIAGNDIVGELP